MRPFSEVRVVNIETVSGCNLECVYCSLRGRPLEFMPPERLKSILGAFDGCRDDILIALYLGGEPLLNRGFEHLVKLTLSMGFTKVRTHTNGTINRPGLWEGLFDAGLSSVFFSIDGVSPEDYERLRPGAVFSNVKKCAVDAVRARNERPGKHVGILNLIGRPAPLVLNRGLVDVADVFDQVIVERPHSWLRRESIPESDRCGENPQNPCFFSENHMAVDVHGNILPCCLCLNSEVKLGSLLEMSAKEAWEGPMRGLRDAQRRGEEISPCSSCERYVRP